MIRKRMNRKRTLDSYLGISKPTDESKSTDEQVSVETTLTDTYEEERRNVMLFVEASAGTGKTTCIANGYGNIAPTKRPLCLSFTNSAVKQIRIKCGLSVEQAKVAGMLTFAGFAWRVCTQLGMNKMRPYKCKMKSLAGNLNKVLLRCIGDECSLYVNYLECKGGLSSWLRTLQTSPPQCLLDKPMSDWRDIADNAVKKVQSKMLASKKGLCEATRDDLAILLLKGIETEADLPDVAKLFLNRGAIIDEAQDLTPTTLNILDLVLKWRSLEKRPPLALFGDSSQQINAWNGAVNALNKLKYRCSESKVTRVELTLTKSFRFGPDVAKLRNFMVSCTRFRQDWSDMTASGRKKTPILEWTPDMVPAVIKNKTVTVLCRSHNTLRDLALNAHDKDVKNVFIKNLTHEVWNKVPISTKKELRTKGEKKGSVVFQTIHAMKGEESDVVYVAQDVLEWFRKSNEAVSQEEVCLAIVALTRVKTTALYIPPILYKEWVHVNR